MEQLVQHFEKISAIIRSNRNCNEHYEGLVRLIENFYNFHIKTSGDDKFRETGILTYVLYNQLNEKYEGLVETKSEIL